MARSSAPGRGPTVGIGGLGYMGLATGLAFARRGRTVLGFDIRKELREQLRAGRSPIYERGLAGLLASEVRSGRFQVVESWKELAERAEVIFLCLPTPRRESGAIDLGAIRAGSRELGDALREAPGYRLVVVKSTVVPGTTESVVRPILERASGRSRSELGVASNPEFLAEGTMVEDALRPWRIVAGTSSARDARLLRAAYRGFPSRFVSLTPTGAELVKYSSNAFLAVKVNFANEISRVAEAVGVDVDEVMSGVGLDPRIGDRFLSAGPGFGGSCFEKDVRALLRGSADRGIRLRMVGALLSANEDQTRHAFELVERAAGPLKGRSVAVLGLAFKAGTDDVRESRALPLVAQLLAAGATVRAHDPVAIETFRRAFDALFPGHAGKVEFAGDVEEALRGASASVIQAGWPLYASWPRRWSGLMKQPVVVDLRRALPPRIRARGDIEWVGLGVGRPEAPSAPAATGTPARDERDV